MNDDEYLPLFISMDESCGTIELETKKKPQSDRTEASNGRATYALPEQSR